LSLLLYTYLSIKFNAYNIRNLMFECGFYLTCVQYCVVINTSFAHFVVFPNMMTLVKLYWESFFSTFDLWQEIIYCFLEVLQLTCLIKSSIIIIFHVVRDIIFHKVWSVFIMNFHSKKETLLLSCWLLHASLALNAKNRPISLNTSHRSRV